MPAGFRYNPRPPASQSQRSPVRQNYNMQRGQGQTISISYAKVLKDDRRIITEWITSFDPNRTIDQIYDRMNNNVSPEQENIIYDVVNNYLHRFIGTKHSDFGNFIVGIDDGDLMWPTCHCGGITGIGSCESLCIGASCGPTTYDPDGPGGPLPPITLDQNYEVKIVMPL